MLQQQMVDQWTRIVGRLSTEPTCISHLIAGQKQCGYGLFSYSIKIQS
jgi:hypothetical protein